MPSFNPDVLEHDVKAALMMRVGGLDDGFISRVAKIVPSTHSFERYPYIGQTPAFQDLAAHGEVPYTSLPGKAYTLTNKEFVGGIEFKLSDLEDDAAGLIRERVGEFADEYIDHRYQTVIDAIVNGSSSTLGVGYDGAAFFSASHPGLGGEGTQDNTISSTGQTVAAVQTDLNTALAKMLTLKDERNRPLNRRLTSLLIVAPPSLMASMKTVLSAQMISNTSNVTFAGINIEVEFDGSLTGNTWYVLNIGREQRPLIFQDRRGLDVAYEEDKTAKRVARWAGSARYVAGYGPWQLAVKVI